MNNIRNYFPGANSYKGFFNYFDQILPVSKNNRFIVIKGGPGTGKSSLMKRIGEEFSLKEYSVEYHHCSSDSDSLDGVVIKDINVGIIDGTAPHIVDPKYPGTIDEILNLGIYFNKDILRKNKNDIISLTDKISFNFKNIYNYLNSANSIQNVSINLNNSLINHDDILSIYLDLKFKIFTKQNYHKGTCRDLFITAISPQGIVDFSKEIDNLALKKFFLKGKPGSGSNFILKSLINDAINNGFNIEVFHNPLNPDFIEHIYLPDEKILVSCDIGLKNYNLNSENIELTPSLLYKTIEEDDFKIKENFENQIQIALDLLSQTKKLHDILEDYYIDAMDFDSLNNDISLLIKSLV